MGIDARNRRSVKVFNQAGISGGKDSTALMLLTIEREIEDIVYTFADTGNEHPYTYEYLEYLEDKLGVEIKRVSAKFTEEDFAARRKFIRNNWGKNRLSFKKQKDTNGNHIFESDGVTHVRETVPGIPDDLIEEICSYMHPTGNVFLDLCVLRTSFPATKRKFCSIELKQVPMLDQVIAPLMADGYTVVSWQGVRAQESFARKDLDIVEEEENGIIVYRPLITWKHEDVFALAKRHGIKPNPLYEQGMGRVGCMPCINCTKSELAQISLRFPDEIRRIARWEELVKKVCRYTNATGRKSGPSFLTKYDKNGQPMTIDQVVTWSKTVRGGKVYDLQFDAAIDPDSCSAVYPVVCE